MGVLKDGADMFGGAGLRKSKRLLFTPHHSRHFASQVRSSSRLRFSADSWNTLIQASFGVSGIDARACDEKNLALTFLIVGRSISQSTAMAPAVRRKLHARRGCHL